MTPALRWTMSTLPNWRVPSVINALHSPELLTSKWR
jgi:hypothetical protein